MKKLTSLLLALFLLFGLSSVASSWEGHYRYRQGHYYREAGWWGLGGFLTGLAVGSNVASLPPRYEINYIEGVPYYYADGYYYEASPGGYVVVAPPSFQGQTAPMMNNTFFYILGPLLGILAILGIVLMVKKLYTKEIRST